MTEQEWLTCDRWWPLWHESADIGLLSERKARLFAVASFRRLIHHLADPHCLQAVEICERCADGNAQIKELEEARRSLDDHLSEERLAQRLSLVQEQVIAGTYWLCSWKHGGPPYAINVAPSHGWEVVIAAGLASPTVSTDDYWAIKRHPTYQSGVAEALRIQADLLREVIGNPFRRITFNPEWLSWNDDTVRRVAQVIYDDRAFDRMPILADALEDVGCDNADILNHCRSGGEHVRGCWVVDLLLGKS